MNFIPVDCVPKKNTPKAGDFSEFKPMRSYLREFMNMNVKTVKVIFKPFEYANPKSACTGFGQTVRRAGLPVKVSLRGDDIYLTRTDLED
jgi:hypothetical protein